MNFNTYNHTDKELTELEELICEQALDMAGRQGHGEYLGGNGQTEWHHTAARDNSGHGEDTSEDSDMTGFERELMSYFVSSHQDSIEDNGQLIVRGLGHWSTVPVIFGQSQRIGSVYAFDGDKARAKRTRDIRNSLGLTRGQKREGGNKYVKTAAERKAARLAKLQRARG